MGQDPQSIDSIFDFLFVDNERLRSWFAQVFDDGVLLSHKKTSHSGDASSKELSGTVEVGGKIDAFLASADMKGKGQARDGSNSFANTSHEKNFDATWSLPLSVLDRLDEFSFIQRDISTARIGSLVLLSGRPQIIDIKFMQDIWEPAVNFVLGNQKITHKNKTEASSAKAAMANLNEIFRKMPPSPQMLLCDENENLTWACIKEEHMVVSTSSLALTHGDAISGNWHVLGVLDAVPNEYASEPLPLWKSELLQAASNLLGSIREMMGRPTNAYGITPVLIFRTINAA